VRDFDAPRPAKVGQSFRWPVQKASVWKRYGYLWVTGAAFLFFLVNYYLFGLADGKTWMELHTGFFENMQSEFGQLLWQVGGLMVFFAVGSAQSKNESERVEAKIDWLMHRHPEGNDAIESIDQMFMRE
jgi:hypothetical protein